MHYLGAMSTDIAAGLSTIEGHADTALGVAVGIGVASLLGTSLNDFSDNLPYYKEMINTSATNFFTYFEE